MASQRRYVSLITKFALIFGVFIIVMLVMSGLSEYFNQTRIDRETRLTHMQQINTYFDSLITRDNETFLAYQELLIKYKDEVAIPIDVVGYGDAEVDFYNSFYREYPDGTPGEKPTYYEMSEELQKKFVVFQHEYWLDIFEQARTDMNIPYTYYVVPTGKEEGHVYWLIDAFRDPSEVLGEKYMNLCLDVLDAPEDGHENMWYALNKGEPAPGYDTYDNEFGKTYAYYRPVIIDGKVRGAIGVEVEIATVNKNILRSTLRQVASMAVILVIAVVILLYFINVRYIRKIEHLSENVKHYGEEKNAAISTAIENEITENDELAVLANQTAAMILELDNYMKNIIATTRELTQTRAQAERLGQLAVRDALTGIRNKTAYDDDVEKLNKALNEGNAAFGIAVVDLNYLKHINDNYGHEKGNMAIKRICAIVCRVFTHSPVFRIGGDEFTVILKNHDYDNIDNLIGEFKNILKTLKEDSSLEPWEGVSAAIGYALYDEDRDVNVESVFKRADQAMYEDKKAMKASREG